MHVLFATRHYRFFVRLCMLQPACVYALAWFTTHVESHVA